MIQRQSYLERITQAVDRSPITALLGPRQCGKTTLAREFAKDKEATFYDLESQPDQSRLQFPEMSLGVLKGLVVLDEIQLMPELFNVLRILVDRPENQARFLILGSASPVLIKNVSETLRGSVEYYLQSLEARPQHLAGMRNEVTSPGGTTAAAMYFLEKAGFRTAISRAIWAAYERSLELGKDPRAHAPESG